MAIIIIHGPEACGKTRNSAKLRAHYKSHRVRDDWHPGIALREGDLALTNFEPPFFVAGARTIPFADALKACNGRSTQ